MLQRVIALCSISVIVALLFFMHPIDWAPSFVASVEAQACAAPAATTGVQVEYPGCASGTTCDLAQASCKWNSQADAASYNVTVTEVETGTLIKNNESEAASVTKIVFPITQGKTYKCDVVAVSACGGLGAPGTDQLLCKADALIDTPTPTLIPTKPAAPPTATPTIAKPGGMVQSIGLIGGILLAIVGGIVLLVL